MPRKLNNKIASVERFVNIALSLAFVLVISIGYFGTISELPLAT
ncbi:MAG: hypothetical protein ACWA5L_08955 [bacterium]